MKILLEHGLIHGDALTITGKTIAEVLADVPPSPQQTRMSSAHGTILYTRKDT